MSTEVRVASPVSIPRTDQHCVRANDGAEYRVMMAWPESSPPVSGFPVVYLLDAQYSFGTFVEGARLRARRADATGVGPGLIVGIAYPPGEADERERRRFDYTLAGSGEPGTGGSVRLQSLLAEVVKPLVARTFPVDAARQALFGHSLAGRFVLGVLTTSPGSFDTYIAVSPSIWWQRKQLLCDVDALAARRGPEASASRVMITVGEYEQTLAPRQVGTPGAEAIAARRRERRMVDDAREVAAKLGSVCGIVSFEEFAGEDHASVVMPSISKALRFCLSPREQT